MKELSKRELLMDILRRGKPIDGLYGKFKLLNEREVDRVERIVLTLSDPEERAVLIFRYHDGMQWKEVAGTLDTSMTSVRRIHDNAIDHLLKTKGLFSF